MYARWVAPCPTCGGSFSDAVFCPRDGTRLAQELTTGEVLDGRYRLVREVGAGAMGVVYEAEHVQLHRRVAVKLIKHQLAGNPEAVQRLEREAQLTSDLGHPNIVQCRDFGFSADGRVYMVMEWLDGETLEARLDRDGVDLTTAVEIAKQTCAALAEAHAHDVVHRDLKPANLFLTQDRAGLLRVKVLDFGIAKLSEAQVALTATGVVIGTPNYMSPEQAIGDGLDARADIYALGVILYEMIAGTVPFRGDSALSVLHQHSMRMPVAPTITAPERAIPPELENIVMRCLEKRPADRFASAGKLGEALATFQSGPKAAEPEPAAAADEDDDPEPPARRRGGLWIIAGSTIALGVGLGLFFALRGGSHDDRPGPASLVPAADAVTSPTLDGAEADALALVASDAMQIDAGAPQVALACRARFFECTASMTPNPTVGTSFGIDLVLVGRDSVHTKLLADGKLAGRIEMKDKRTHAIVHEATAAFDPEGRWTMTVRLDRALTYHVHVDLLDQGRELDSANLPDLTVAAP